MGRKKINKMILIEDVNLRKTTFKKRLNGLIKKAIELSKLCDQNIYMAVFDKTRKHLVQYKSSKEFSAKVVEKLTQP